ncbi:GNAT family N-acetyltransferase [Duganella callida]|nr:GNAT family N-acetyltransferase [Duganella callida]
MMPIDYLEGTAAAALLEDAGFRAEWRQLHARVPEASGFQTPGFALAWYRSYAADWRPVLLLQRAADGTLAALWPLAHDGDGALVHAGQHQAEYHGWLCLPELEAGFVAAAWRCLCARLSFVSLRFKYLRSARAAALLRDAIGADRVLARGCPRPLMRLDAAEIAASAAKKSNKSRFNRLKKLGELSFRRITDIAELERIFDELIRYYDFRQSAINQTAPFREDPHKRAFHLAQFALAGDQLCVTASYLDQQPIAAFWGTLSGKTVHLGMLISSPFLAEHSPGKLHLMQLSDYLVRQGVEMLDLTPGGDAWKERFANSHDEVFDLMLYRQAGARRSAVAKQVIAARLKAGLGQVGITPAQVRAWRDRLSRINVGSIRRKLQSRRDFTREYRVYRAERSLVDALAADGQVRVNAIDDLLCFEPGESWQSRDAYLSSALERLEAGTQAYTICVDGQLAHSGWMSRQSASYMTEVKQQIELPEGSVTLYDFYSHPDWRGRGYYRLTLSRMLRDAFASPATQYAYIMVLADNGPSRHVIEKLGFAFQAAYFLERRGGQERTWRQPA